MKYTTLVEIMPAVTSCPVNSQRSSPRSLTPSALIHTPKHAMIRAIVSPEVTGERASMTIGTEKPMDMCLLTRFAFAPPQVSNGPRQRWARDNERD